LGDYFNALESLYGRPCAGVSCPAGSRTDEPSGVDPAGLYCDNSRLLIGGRMNWGLVIVMVSIELWLLITYIWLWFAEPEPKSLD
jgi:hypothetical protein